MAFAQIVQLFSQGERVQAHLQVYRAAAHARTGTLARPRPHLHTRTRTEDTTADLPTSLGLVNGGFLVCAQHSARRRQPESFRKPPGGCALVVEVS